MSSLVVAALLYSQTAPVEAFAPVAIRSSTSSCGRASFLHARTPPATDTKTSPFISLFKSDESEATDADVVETKGMPDLISFLGLSKDADTAALATSSSSSNDGLTEFDGDIDESLSFGAVFSVVALVGGAVLFAAANYLGVGVDDVLHTASSFFHNPQQTMTDLIEDLKEIGPAAPLFFGLLYTIAEVLAVPATPLTLSAGYLFGLPLGTATVLASGTVAACIGFAIGKTALRGAVEGLLEENPEFRKLDKAIGKEGFKLLVLVRLTPIFPFSISNYIYGASAIKFWPYFWGTVLGFAPGSVAYVYTGMVGQAVMTGKGDQPWYFYAGGLLALGTLLKMITDTATGIVRSMEDDMED
eukprot:scaffold3069_cov215-Amphora_coffeaeformis.AAC.17